MLVVAGLRGPSQAGAVEYELHGYAWREYEVQHQTWTRVGSMTADAFSVYVRDEAWLVRTVVSSSSSGWRPSFILEVGSTNGHEIVRVQWWLAQSPPDWVVRSNRAPAFGARALPPPGPWPPASAVIWSNPVPPLYDGDWFSAHLWLMLAGGCYLLRQTNRELIPVYDSSVTFPSHSPYRGLRLDADWQLSRQEPHLPWHVAYWNKRGFPHVDPQGKLRFVPFQPPGTERLEAFYAVTGSTNVGGLVLPTGFVFKRFTADGSRLTARNSLYVVVTNASARCSRASLLPPLPVIRITDYRLLEAEPALAKMEYPALHLRRWPTVAESKRAYLAWQRKKQWEVQRAKPWQLAGFGLLLLAPVAWAWLHSGRRRSGVLPDRNGSLSGFLRAGEMDRPAADASGANRPRPD